MRSLLVVLCVIVGGGYLCNRLFGPLVSFSYGEPDTTTSRDKKKKRKDARGFHKQPKNVFQFTVLNEAATKVDEAYSTMIQLQVCDSSTVALTQQIQTHAKRMQDKRQQMETNKHGKELVDMVNIYDENPCNDLVKVNIVVNLYEDSVVVKLNSVSLEEKLATIDAPSDINRLARACIKSTTFVFRFIDQEPLAPMLQLLTQFVDLAVRRGVPGKDRVVIILQSPGRPVDEYGLAASQLVRLRRKELHLTVCVDQIAASGGYLMACVANHVVAAPFATIGSIGVVVQYFNMHKLLQKYDVCEKTITAGSDKRLISQFSDFGPEAEAKTKEQLEQVHRRFKTFVKKYRPDVDVDFVSSGATWMGEDALQHKLIDDVMTSDEFLQTLMSGYVVLHVEAWVKEEKDEDWSLWRIAFGNKNKNDDKDEDDEGNQSCSSSSSSNIKYSMQSAVQQFVQSTVQASLQASVKEFLSHNLPRGSHEARLKFAHYDVQMR